MLDLNKRWISLMGGTRTAFLRAVESNGAILHPNKIKLLGVTVSD